MWYQCVFGWIFSVPNVCSINSIRCITNALTTCRNRAPSVWSTCKIRASPTPTKSGWSGAKRILGQKPKHWLLGCNAFRPKSLMPIEAFTRYIPWIPQVRHGHCGNFILSQIRIQDVLCECGIKQKYAMTKYKIGETGMVFLTMELTQTWLYSTPWHQISKLQPVFANEV